MPYRKLLPALLLLLAPALATAQTLTPQKKAAIEQLMDITGASRMKAQFGDAYVKQAQAMFAAANPNMPPRALAIVAQETRAVLDARLTGERGLLAAVYPIYHKHFTLEELEAMLAYYRSAAGKKALAVMPQVTLESMQAGQRWAQSVGQAVQIRVEQRLAAEGLR